jgi:dUTP pyrophosphatase
MMRVRDVDFPLPDYANPGDAGMDLRAAESGFLKAREFKPWPTGIAVEIPAGFEGQVRPRSGLAAKFGVTVLNSPGTIDSAYRGEIMVILINHGTDPFEIKRGDRIAQLVIAPIFQVQVEAAWSLGETVRGLGGLGSTGIR